MIKKIVSLFLCSFLLNNNAQEQPQKIAYKHHLKQFTEAFNVVKKLYTAQLLHFPEISSFTFFGDGIVIEEYEFYNQQVIRAMQHAYIDNDFSTFLLLVNNITHKEQPPLDQFKEVTLGLICILKSTVRYHDPEEYHEWIIYESLKNQKLSLSQALTILEILVHELPPLFEKYEMTSSLSWKDWSRKHWFIFPVALTALLLRTYLTTIQ